MALAAGGIDVGGLDIAGGISSGYNEYNVNLDLSDIVIDPKLIPKDPLLSKTVIRIVDVYSEGEIGGLVDGLKSVYLNNVPVQKDDGTYNFEGVTIEERVGTPDQTPVQSMLGVDVETTLNYLLEAGVPKSFQITDTNVKDVIVKIEVSQLWVQNPKTGDLNTTILTLDVHISADGGPDQYVGEIHINGKTLTSYMRNYRIQNLSDWGDGPWTIKITKTSAEPTNQYSQNTCFLSAYVEYYDANMMYPDCAYTAITIDSELYGNDLPTRSYLIDGLKIKIPSNYDPISRTYDSEWDGTFKVEWSDNPAWVFYDLLTSTRYGLGLSGDDPPDMCSKWLLYSIGQYCDEMVDDGQGGYEPRFTMNLVLNSMQEAYHVLNFVASAFQAMPYWATGQVKIVQDSPTDPTRLVTPANVEEGKIIYEGSALKARHTVALVTWNDPSDNYKLVLESVQDDEGIERYGWNPIEVPAVGCTSRGQARRFGRWILESELNQPEVVKYVAGYDHVDCLPGEVIQIADPARNADEARHGGRIIDVNSALDEIEIDDPFTFEAGKSYTLHVVHPDMTLESQTISNSPGETTTVTLTSPLSIEPQELSVWMIEDDSDLVPREFRVVSNEEIEPNKFAITAVYHDSTKYARIEGDMTFDNEPTVLASTPLNAPANVVVTEFTYEEGQTHSKGLEVSWAHVDDSRLTHYLLEMRFDNPNASSSAGQNVGGWGFAYAGSANSYTVLGIREGTYWFRVKAVAMGSSSVWTTSEAKNVTEVPTSPLPAPTNLRIKGMSSSSGNDIFTSRDLEVEWDAVEETQITDSDIADWAGSITYTTDDVVYHNGTFYKCLVSASTGVEPGVTSGWETDWENTVVIHQSTRLRDYKVEVKTLGGSLLRTEYVIEPHYSYTYEKNVIDNDESPISDVRIVVASRDVYLVLSPDSVQADFSNEAPATPTGLSALGVSRGVEFEWNPNTEIDFDYYEYEIDVVENGQAATWAGVWIKTKNTKITRSLSADERSYYGIDATIHIRVRAYDTFGNVSASTTTSGDCEILDIEAGDIEDFAIDPSKLDWKVPVLKGDSWVDNSNDGTPGSSPGSIWWNEHTLYYDGVEYIIASGTTSNKFIYWESSNSSYSSSNSNPSLGDGEFAIATNISGVHDLAWNAIANEIIGTAYIQDLAVTNAKVNDMSVDKLTAGTLDVEFEIDIGGSIHSPYKTAFGDSDQGFWLGIDGGVAKFDIGDGGSYLQWDGSNLVVSGGIIQYLQSGSDLAIQGWQFNGIFSSADYNTVEWTSGTLWFQNGESFSIDAGNTGDMSALTYIYFDKAASQTALQTTTTASDAVGENKVLICAAKKTSSGEAAFINYGAGGYINIDGEDIVAGSVTANEIAANTITASEIKGDSFGTLTITAGKIIIQTADGLEIDSSNGMVVKSGGDLVIEQGGDLILEGGSSGDPSLIRLRDESVKGEIRFEQVGDSTKYWTIFKSSLNDTLYIGPSAAIEADDPYIAIGIAPSGAGWERANTVRLDSNYKVEFQINGSTKMSIIDGLTTFVDNIALTAGKWIGSSGSNARFVFNASDIALTDGSLSIGIIAAGTSDYDKFLVSDGGQIKYRTGAQVLSDIGGAKANEVLYNISEDSTPALGGNLDLNDNYIVFETAITDDTAEGIIIQDTVGEAVEFGDLLYYNIAAGEWMKADADAEATMPVMGMALETASDGFECDILIDGVFQDSSLTPPAGQPPLMYASTTPGPMTGTKPSGTGDQVQIVGYYLGGDTYLFRPDLTYVELV